MKTRVRIPSKAVSKSPQQPIQTTLERHSISRDLAKNLTSKTSESISASSKSNLFSHNLSTISVLAKRKVTTIPSISDRVTQSQHGYQISRENHHISLRQFKTIQPHKTTGENTINSQQQPQGVQNISSSPQQVQGWGVKISTPKWVKDAGSKISNAGKKLVGGVSDWFTKQFNSGKSEAQGILKRARKKANRVIGIGKAKARRIANRNFRKSHPYQVENQLLTLIRFGYRGNFMFLVRCNYKIVLLC